MKKKEKFKINFGKLNIEGEDPGKNSIIIIGMTFLFVVLLVIVFRTL